MIHSVVQVMSRTSKSGIPLREMKPGEPFQHPGRVALDESMTVTCLRQTGDVTQRETADRFYGESGS